MRCGAHAVIFSISANASAGGRTDCTTERRTSCRTGSNLARGLMAVPKRKRETVRKPMIAGGFFTESDVIPGTSPLEGDECGGGHAVTGERTAMTTRGKWEVARIGSFGPEFGDCGSRPTCPSLDWPSCCTTTKPTSTAWQPNSTTGHAVSSATEPRRSLRRSPGQFRCFHRLTPPTLRSK
jgi:hypothetical protein